MPYRINSAGMKQLTAAEAVLTKLQRMALAYLKGHRGEGFIESSTIAKHYRLAPQAMRGPMWHLHRRGLIDKA